ncbi:MAG: GNAT family N-acetyltransferase [Promethearchaeota archaeon]
MAEEQKSKEDKEEKNEVFPFIEGKTIDLVAANSKWANLFCSWINNPKVRHYSRNMWPQSLEEVKKRFEPSPDRRIRDKANFMIYHKQEKRPIGVVGLDEINWVSRNANLFALIGEPEHWGKGIAVEACALVIKYGFTELNLHKIDAGIFSPNQRSLRAAEKLGFEKEAIIKEEIYIDGKYHDNHRFSLFKDDWIQLEKEKQSQ